MNDKISVDDLTLHLRRSDRRQTIGITVERDGSLVVAAPTAATRPEIEDVIRQKQFWIYSKLTEKELLRGPGPRPREFVSGEGFYYLGRSYRLLLVDVDDEATPSLQLKRGRFRLRRDALAGAADHFIQWYQKHAEVWLAPHVSRFAHRLTVEPAGFSVQDIGYRWGSCGKGDTLYFHWRTICLPPRIVEYVIVHELAHLHEPTHGDDFWQRIERAMPDYNERKRWLAQHGQEYALTFA